MKDLEKEEKATEAGSERPRHDLASLAEATLRPDDAGRRVGLRGFLAGSKETLREALDYRGVAQTPYGLAPVIILAMLVAFAGFAGAVFATLAPEIVRDLDVDLRPLANVFGIVDFALIFITLYAGYLADRIHRVRLMGTGVIVNGLSLGLLSRAQNLWTIGGGLSVGGVGGTAAGAPTAALVADWYPVNTWGRVIAILRVLGTFAGAATPLLLLWMVDKTSTDLNHPNWRLPYLIAAPAIVLVGILMLLRLKEPVRGYMERIYIGVPEELARIPEEPPSFGEAWRGIWAIRTLRRLFFAQIISGPGGSLIGFYFVLYLFQVYQLSFEDRARLNFITALPLLPAAILAGGLADVLLRRRPERIVTYVGLVSLFGSITLFFVIFEPPLWVIYGQGALFFTAIALLGPAQTILFLSILPSHIRGMGTAVQALANIPATIIYFFLVNGFIGSRVDLGVVMASPFFFIGALITISAAGFIQRDIRAARAAAVASEDWVKAKTSGEAKMLVCRDIDVEYDGVQVLFGVDFDVQEGEIIALLGTNGAGKSTLLKAIAGTVEPSSGAIVFEGRDITHMPPHETTLRGVVLCPGGGGVFPGMSVRENLTLGNWLNTDKEAKARLEEIYRVFPILKERGGGRAALLSGGEQRMLSLAQAFLSRPRLLMIDELSFGLSPAAVQQMIEVVRAFHAQGTTVILVEQSVNVALTVAERAIFMEKGEVKFVGRTRDLLTRPDILRAVYVKGTGALVEGAPAAMKSERERRAYQLQDAPPVLEVREVSKAFGGIVAVDDVSLSLREGEILGLIGPNGAGKTTLFDLITGYQIPDSGTITYDGADITALGPDERAKRRLIRRFQDARLFPSLTVYENLLVSLERKLEVRSMPLIALQLPQVRQAERRIRRRAERLVELLELGSYRDKFLKELSTGLRRITDLACVLAAEPKVLLLDEPSTGIAQAEAEMLAPLLRRVRFETGCSILIIEHDMPLIGSISDELIAMDQGRVLTRGLPDAVLNNEAVIQSYLGASEEVIRRSGALQ